MRYLLDQLEALDRAHPQEHKLLICQDVNHGRELLVSLARRKGGWMGWEATTVAELARELAFTALGRTGLRAANDLEIAAVVDQALVGAVRAGRVTPAFAELAGSLGFRGAVRDALLQLRVAGIEPARLRTAAASGTPAHDLAAVMESYQTELTVRGWIDTGGIFALATTEFQREAPYVLRGVMAMLPAPSQRGLVARLHQQLLGAGALILAEPDGAPPPEVDGFRAATVADELREALRRVRAEGRRWDEVELVVTDPECYAVSFDALATRLAIPSTMLMGIPLARTRLGRALERWLDWLESGLPAEQIRIALDAGDLGEPQPLLTLAFRSLAIGWGRARYEEALSRLTNGEFPAPPRGRDGESSITEVQWREALVAVRGLLGKILACTPAVPEPQVESDPSLAPGELARHAGAMLALMPEGGAAEAHARARLGERLGDLTAMRSTPVPFPLALAEFRGALTDFRAWSDLGQDGKPWLSGGGSIHLTDLEHAGASGRPRLFLLGLDADRTAGPRLQDPLLPDALRGSLGLATTAERREERHALLEQTFRGLAGRVTLSYAVEGSGGREASPAAMLLERGRTIYNDPDLTYDALRLRLGSPVSPVPDAGTPSLDARDAWFRALAPGALLRDGSAAVSAAFPGLAAGLEAAAAWSGTALHAQHGIVTAASGLDPRRHGGLISASSLEMLARCPRAWFYRYALELAPPDDAMFDPEQWLDSRERGGLLHAVFERFGREFAGRRTELDGAGAEERLIALGDAAIAEWLVDIPAPSSGVLEREREEIRQVLRGFLLMERQLEPGREWESFELGFGFRAEPASLELPGGDRLGLTGRIDRVDRGPGETRTVVDYKTGSASRYGRNPKFGPFRGGRQLQAGVYAAVAAQLTGTPIARFEYRFPSERGQHRVVAYQRAELAEAPGLVRDLLDEVARGHFLPSNDASDCGWCDFRSICRVTEDGYYNVTSPRADWAEDQGAALEIFAPMRRRRSPTP